MATTYFKKYTGKKTSIVDALKAVGAKDTSLAYRKQIGKLNGINNVGTTAGNDKMLALLKKGKLIRIKDTATPKAKKKAASKKKTSKKAEKFVAAMQEEHAFIKKHGKKFFYSSSKAKKTFNGAKNAVLKGNKTGLTCVVPTRWGLRTLGIDPGGFYGKKGKFTGDGKKMSKHLKKITKGGPVGKTIKQAVKAGLMEPGDIIVFKDKTHTVAYTGKGCKVFDGGGSAESRGYSKVGIILDYSKVGAWKGKKISGILRWR